MNLLRETTTTTRNFVYNKIFGRNHSVDRSVVQSNVNAKYSRVAGFMKAVPGSVQYNAAVDSDTKVHNNVFKTVRSVKNDLHFRSRSPFKQLAVKSRKLKSRDREPSGISLRKVSHSLKFRKLRLKVKHVVKKSVHASSGCHNIATNYKWWKIRHIERQTSFFSNYFF